MATLDLSRATVRIDMLDANIVKFDTVETKTSTSWSFNNGRSDDLQLDGSGMSFDSKGRALTGTVTRIGIDLGDNDFDNPDILVTGIKAKAATLDDGGKTFWRFLEGDDTIIGPSATDTAVSVVFGDAEIASQRYTLGGDDTILLGYGPAKVMGDLWSVGAPTGDTIKFQGGADEIVGIVTIRDQYLIGDSNGVSAGGELMGGNDTILIQAESTGSFAVGDASFVGGVSGRTATLHGGDDHISAGARSVAALVGDVANQFTHSTVYGGDDVLVGADWITVLPYEPREVIVGDVSTVGGVLLAGHDKIFGNDGDDFLYGDFVNVGASGKVTAGNDTVRGGTGDDSIFGDGVLEDKTTGGNDRLYGDTGKDTIWGGRGNDYLDGGSSVDRLLGGTGNDTYVVDNDSVQENAGEGVDTILTKSTDLALPDNFENLTYIGTGDFFGTGNVLANTMKGSAGADFLQGQAGKDKLIGGAHNDSLYGGLHDDVLIGAAGADQLDGGEGFDIASYEGSEKGVNASLDGSIPPTGDAREDTFLLIEGLRGSSYGDALAGNDDNNRLEGGGGDDALLGLGGTDVLVGGKGLDNLTGGADSDRFVFTAIPESGTTKSTRDVIRDFTKGQDLIDLAAIDANTGVAGNNAFKLLAKGTEDSAVGTGRIGWYQINQPGTGGDKTILRINNDADAAIDMTIEIRGLVSFAAGDFVL